jgi:phosphohistidine phosphatase
MGVYMGQNEFEPDLVLCSTAARARETWATAAVHLSGAPEVIYERALYLAEPAAILKHVKHRAENRSSVLVIGHNPGLQALAQSLAHGALGSSQKFPTACLAVFAVDVTWPELGPDHTRLIDYVLPKSLI